MKNHNLKLQLVLTILLLSFSAGAQRLTGTVKNVTTGAPAVGDEVILLSLGQGMEEAGRTRTDSKGKFTFKLDGSEGPHLIRAIHQDITYHRLAPLGTASVEVEVYDVGKKIDGIEVVADILRMQTGQGQLEFKREFAVQNSSQPPRTQMNVPSLEFYIPDGATLGEGSALTEHGNPLKTAPVLGTEKNRYSFNFPLRPGITRFQVSYKVPYSGSARIDPQSLYALQHFVAIVPKSMEFSGAATSHFKSMNDPNQPDANVQVASATTPGQSLAFRISGEGTLQARVEAGGAQGENASAQSEKHSDGQPQDAPDPVQRYRWYIIGGFVGVMLAGAVYAGSRQRALHSEIRPVGQNINLKRSEAQHDVDEAPDGRETQFDAASLQPPPARSSYSMLMEGLKEELFRLEVERRQGEISQLEYQTAREALEHMLERALNRETAKLV